MLHDVGIIAIAMSIIVTTLLATRLFTIKQTQYRLNKLHSTVLDKAETWGVWSLVMCRML